MSDIFENTGLREDAVSSSSAEHGNEHHKIKVIAHDSGDLDDFIFSFLPPPEKSRK
jgi:hypothetical protein